MSDAVIICIITNATVIIVAALSRLLSHNEHKQTSKDVKHIKNVLNGNVEE